MPSKVIAEGILRKARTGWSVQNDHPVCAFKGGFALFFS